MRSPTVPFLLLGATCLVTAESDLSKKKCSSVFPSLSSVVPVVSATASISSSGPLGTSSQLSSTYNTTSSSQNGSSSSSDTSKSATVDATPATISSTSTTGSIMVTSSPEAVRTVVNDVGNGNFGSYDANSPGGIANWNSENCELNLQYGYQGDGSGDSGCVQMTAAPAGALRKAKRTDYTAMIEQQLENVDETSQYTMRFYYSILSNTLADTCRMEAYYGNTFLTASDYFGVVTNAQLGNTPWVEFVDEAALSSSDGYIRFQLSCTGNGTAVVFIDEVFVSNKIGAESKDNISLEFTSTVSATSTTSTISTTSESTTSIIDITASTDSTDSTSMTTLSATESAGTGTPMSTVETSSLSSSGSIASSSMEPASASSSISTAISSTTTLSSSTTSLTTESSAATPTTCFTTAVDTTGLVCGSLIYTNKGYYKQVRVSDVTRDQCVAACLADSECQSISYYSTQSCSATCFLQSSSVAAMGYTFQSGNGFPAVWDKGCFTQKACDAPAEGSVCIDKWGSSPASTCKSTFMGKAKSCAQPFKTTTVSGLCGSGACAALCKQYPSCKTYSATYGGSVTCSFYSGDISDIAESASSATTFTDMSCLECGSNSSVYNWLTPLADPNPMPDLSSCMADGSSTTSTTSTTSLSSLSSLSSSTASSATSQIMTTPGSTTISSLSTSSTATATTASTTSCVTCTAVSWVSAGSTCGVQGDFTMTDAYGVSSGNQNSIMDCAAICSQDSSCKAYGYRANSNPHYGCAFIQTNLTAAGFYTSSSANYYWSDKACARCNNNCPSSSSSSAAAASTSISATTLSTLTMSASLSQSSSTFTPASATVSSSASATCIPTAKLTAGVTCGLPGSDTSANVIETVTAVSSLSTCATHCLLNAQCLSFRYSTSDVSCYVYSTALTDDGLGFSLSSTNYYYDKECFSCS